ncbi:hypothetical protein [Pelagicoccus sp. SDUM812002]|uniref:hypothetical protein n=1 Tax=Pelagicoccus sp. SDUM812002 TaxID=3041266 RepID=UPI00280F3933|nr:hypothetical protein [Pelagicoccus sp. SDUM812002]MDQ8186383.1 hypothetical protein [Pelagicoccus sp. SDUM812002]
MAAVEESSAGGNWKGAALRAVGVALTLLACFFVWKAVRGQADEVLPYLSSREFLVAGISCSLLWVLLNAVLGLLWRELLGLTGSEVGRLDSVRISLLTQVAKYLPGNVFHFAGRIVLAGSLGISKKRAGVATLLEAVFLVGVASLISLRLIATLPYGPWVMGAGLVLFLVAVSFAKKKLERLWREVKLERSGLVRILALAVVFSLLVFVIQATMFFWIESTLFGGLDLSPWQRLELVSASWGAGFLVVGSPGGLGVREYVFSYFADSGEVGPRLVAIAAITRLCSIAGDLLSLLLGVILRKRQK